MGRFGSTETVRLTETRRAISLFRRQVATSIEVLPLMKRVTQGRMFCHIQRLPPARYWDGGTHCDSYTDSLQLLVTVVLNNGCSFC